jgi:hypothetical protein
LPLIKSETQSDREENKAFMIIKENEIESRPSPMILEK